MNILWDRAAATGRLHGLVHDGRWIHVGSPGAIAHAEKALRNSLSMTNPADVRGSDPQFLRRSPRVFTIPSDVPFLPSLARAILAGGFPAPDGEPPGPLELSQWTVLLPTRRAVRALTTAFLAAGGGRALILPRIRPLGDVDEDEFAFSPSEPDGIPFAVPPAIPETHQLFLLARLIDEWLADHASGQLARTLVGHPGQVFGLARSLIRLIDSFETEELSLDALGRLLGPDFAAHRQAMLEFLNIIRTRLPQELEAAGLAGRAERRSVLLREEARRLASGPMPGRSSPQARPARSRPPPISSR